MRTVPRSFVDWIVLWAINIGIGGTLIVETITGEASVAVATTIAILLYLLLNASVLWTMARRNKRTGIATPVSFNIRASVLALVAALATIAVIQALPQESDLDLALSSKPLASIQPERRRIFIAFLRNRAASSKKQNADLEVIKQHVLSFPLYSPESFASKERIDEVLSVIRESIQGDISYNERNKADWEQFCTEMAKVDAGYLEDLRQSMSAQNDAADKAVEIERQWYSHTVDLYGLARDHVKEIRIKDGNINLSPGVSAQQFDKEMDTSKTLYAKLLSTEKEQAEAQQEASKRQGLH